MTIRYESKYKIPWQCMTLDGAVAAIRKNMAISSGGYSRGHIYSTIKKIQLLRVVSGYY